MTKRKALLILLVLLLVAELAATGAVLAISHLRGNRLEFLMARLWLPSLFWVSPVEKNSKARFIGYHAMPRLHRS